MKPLFYLLPLLLNTSVFAQDWKAIDDRIMSSWAESVTPENVWPEYPRPQMVRPKWLTLNGLWEYAVTDNRAAAPEEWARSILVPFALETPLSGVGRRIASDEVIWYRRDFDLPAADGQRRLLHFEGVDYKCMVWVNDQFVGSHVGGNLPFSFDVTEAVRAGKNAVRLRVIDGTDDPDLYQLRGKQKRDNDGIWYTPSSGIWAPVWLETVPTTYLESLKITADMHGELTVSARVGGVEEGLGLKVTVLDGSSEVAEKSGTGTTIVASVRNVRRWSPDDPFLYDLRVELLDRDGATLDKVNSYAGFRTVGKATDADGHWRFTLNGAPIFHLGPLDQGWWPGSFLLPPADAAIVWEMNYLKAAGYNMIRKHKKAEIRRYYYHADRLGFLIWQDQTSGGSGGSEWPVWRRPFTYSADYNWENSRVQPDDPLDADWPDWAHAQYMSELKTMIDVLHNHPSVVVWTTFNEAWGQHRSLEVGRWVEAYDPTRLLNIASGGNFFPVGDIVDHHDYPHPSFPLDVDRFNDYIKVVGEYGGHGFVERGHLWDLEKRNWGYGGLPETKEEYIERYVKSATLLGELKRRGISAGVYTQTSDVEGELNGLVTYDRKVKKIPAAELRRIHLAAGLIE